MLINRLMDKEDMSNIHVMGYYSAIKKNQILPLQQHGWTWHYTKQNKSDRERQILYDIT